ncbi:Receptor-type tyrosine-protein phosphatase kappa [Anthophora retusa]
MNVLTLLFLVTQIPTISGKLTVLRGKEQPGKDYAGSTRKLICMSDDDDSALIWNRDLNWVNSSYELPDEHKNAEFNCLNKYHIRETDWLLTSSTKMPMGPVFDRQWEGFWEYNNFKQINEFVPVNVHFTESFVISVRACSSVYIYLCRSVYYKTDTCFGIVVTERSGSQAKIINFDGGVQKKSDEVFHDVKCSSMLWKTYVIKWDINRGFVSVYDTKELLVRLDRILTRESAPYLLFLRSPMNMLARFHEYMFYYTTNSSPFTIGPLRVNTTNICMVMTISVCTKCQMRIKLYDLHDNLVQDLEVIEGPAMIAVHGLPTWQHIKINKTISMNFIEMVKITLVPELKKKISNPMWALSYFRLCPSTGIFKYAGMNVTQDYADGKYFWSNVTCESLNNGNSTVVSSLPDAKINPEFDNSHCPEGKVGPNCSINCYEHFGGSVDCRGTAICDQTGCTCPPGFLGKDCQSNCETGQYGYGCKETCSLCHEKNCNYVTGHCTSSCDNSKRYNIPPFCKIGIDVLPAPNIDFINETTVRAFLPLREEYKLIPSGYYQFVIEKEGEAKSRSIGQYTKILKDTTTMSGYTDDLEPGVSYRISCAFYVNNTLLPIHRKWKNFTTRCTSATNFKVETKNTSLTLKIDEQVFNLYSCPSKWYNYILENCETNGQIDKGNLTKLPLKFTNLTPYTLYKITIDKGGKAFFSQKVRTLDGVPSKVRNVTMILRSNTEVTLKWNPPEHHHGIIDRYEVVFQIQTYLGCRNFTTSPIIETIWTTPAFTSVTKSDLMPYVHYVVKIAAHTSNRGVEEAIEFSTNQTDIATEKYNNFRYENNTLMWDPPKDCTTISGPLVAKIIIYGLSKGVANFSILRKTKTYSINLSNVLYGAETYMAQIYAIRDYFREHNELLFEKLVFTTPPKAPPPVRNLEIYEIDRKTMDVYLRWQEPVPPINGEIQSYLVNTSYNHFEIILKIQPTDYCKLWNEYICASTKHVDQRTELITVSAVNVNVSAIGTALSVPIIREEMKPDVPEIFVVEAFGKGLVNLTWSHPWRTGGRLEKFLIRAEMISSRLKMDIRRSPKDAIYEYQVREYQPRYNETLYLLSSSTYKISIRGVTNTEVYGGRKIVEVRTPPAIAFEKELKVEVHNENSTVLLHVPTVLNDTKNSLMNVIVKGPYPCKKHEKLMPYLLEKAGIEHYEIAWSVATFPTDEYAGKTITIGDNKVRGYAINCPLRPAEPYVIVVIVQTENRSMDGQIIVAKTASIRVDEVPKRYDEAWLILIPVFIVVGSVTFCYWRRSKKLILQQEMAVAYNNENLEVKSIASSSKCVCSTTPTTPDKKFLSRASTPYEDSAIYVNDINQRGEQMSLVKVKDFEDYVKQAIDSGLLHRQYNTFPRGQTKPWECGQLPQNKPKNRYVNLIAYDENRVILKKLPDDPYSDYINANYIKGYQKEKGYIATQGPKANTVIDFWRMIWQEECYVICMLANLVEGGKVKCEQYWPDIGKKKKYGDVIVFNAKHTVFADFTFRTLHVTYDDEVRKIEHLHYTAWPDHGVPMSTHSVVTYLKKLLATPPGNGPVVVHCSAGVGRTGTIILCDICLRRANAEGVVDVFSETEAIRSQRANMVDNNQQYLLAHLTLVECLLSFPTTLVCNELLPIKIKELKKQLTIQRDSLEKMTWQDEALRPPTNEVALSERNLAKNRFPELVSAKVSRVYLKRYPSTDEDSDYISAVYADGVRLQNQYLAAQLPLPGTFTDFWRMVAEYKVELIIMLQPPDPKDPTCCPIIPSEEFKPVPYINIRSKEFAEFAHYSSQKLILVDKLEKPVTERNVTILCSTEWKAGRNEEPPATMSLVTLWQAAERISRGDGPTVVLCHDGVTGCGLYLALSFLLERISVEKECDVCLAIRAIRRSRPDFVTSLEHIDYLYDAAITYLKYFEIYANFT